MIMHTVYAFAPSMKTAVTTKTMICDLYVIFFIYIISGYFSKKKSNNHQTVCTNGLSVGSIELLKSKDLFSTSVCRGWFHFLYFV